MTDDQLPLTNYPSPRYQIVPRVLCFVTNGDDVLLIRGAPDKKLWAGKYNGLGGHVERGESAHAAARREIQEESGLSVANLRLRGVISIDVESGPGIGLYVFTALAASRQVTASAEGDLAWVPLGKVAELDTVADLPILVPFVFGQPRDAAPFGAHYFSDADDGLRMAMYSDQTGTDVAMAAGGAHPKRAN